MKLFLYGNAFYFYQNFLGKTGNLNRAPGRFMLEESRIDKVHLLKILHILQENRCLNDILNRATGFFQYDNYVIYDLLGLGRYVSFYYFVAGRVYGYLP